MRPLLRRAVAAAVLAGGLAAQALAQDPAQADADALIAALRVGDTVRIMRAEGLRFGGGVGGDMLPGVSRGAWDRVVSDIYDAGRMEALVSARLADELDGVDVAPLAAFFTSEAGRRIIALELSAREAFLDEEVEATAMGDWEIAQEDRPPLLDRVERLIDDSDLVELNVMGAMNSNLMFYRGLADGGAIEMTEDEILADVWSQEDAMRAESRDWLGSYLMLAYRPLDRADLDAYIALYRSPPGQALNRAIFAAYNQMYEEISYLLGQAVALQMKTEDL